VQAAGIAVDHADGQHRVCPAHLVAFGGVQLSRAGRRLDRDIEASGRPVHAGQVAEIRGCAASPTQAGVSSQRAVHVADRRRVVAHRPAGDAEEVGHPGLRQQVARVPAGRQEGLTDWPVAPD
jgi:hypothetical protein